MIGVLVICSLLFVYISIFLTELLISLVISVHRKSKNVVANTNENHSIEVKHKNTQEKPTKNKKQKIYKKIIFFALGTEKRTLYRVSRIPSHTIRNYLYRHIFKLKMADSAVIYYGGILRCPSRITIGKGSIIGDRCELDGRGGLHIGEDCNLSSEVHIWTGQHDAQSVEFDYETASVQIGDRCWVSSNTIILPGVSMGEGSVLAAGAVLTKDTEPYGIYAGVPAKKIGERNRNLKYNFDGSHDYFM
jgi:acetyltransferase-like isoleucine patch superfamily enzyme